MVKGDSADQTKRLAIVVHRFGPYHRVRIEAALAFFDVVGVELSKQTSHYAWEPVSLSENIRHCVVCEDVDSRALSHKALYQRIDRTLQSINPDAVAINGWSDNGAFTTLRWCQRNQVPAIVMSESNRDDSKRNPLREFVKRRLVSCFAAGLVGGTRAREYLVDLGMCQDRIYDGYDAIDNNHFSRRTDICSSAIRAQLGYPREYFLASNRFIEKKNLPRLIDAYSGYRKEAASWHAVAGRQQAEPETWDLVLLGDGPQKDSLMRQVATLGLNDFVHFPGFRQYQELPTYYWGAGAFVHASTVEQWGLVINEAMAAGLPVIASNRCGSVTDLVVDGETGFVFEPLDKRELTEKMLQISGDHLLRQRMSSAARERIEKWGPDRFACGMKLAFDAAVSAPTTATLLDRLVLRLSCR